jgi:microcystin-dependent protein
MEGFIGQIVMFGGNFAPRSWAFCDGQLLAVSQFDALFSILGTIYGGDGRTTFGLPDLRGRVAIHAGNGPGLSDRRLGARGGTESNTLNITQLPSHTHAALLSGSNASADASDPVGRYVAQSSEDIYSASGPTAIMGGVTAGNTGGNQSFNNMAPSQGINYIIALYGTYPSRN